MIKHENGWNNYEADGSNDEAIDLETAETESSDEVTATQKLGEAATKYTVNDYYRATLPNGLVSPPISRSTMGRR